LATGIAFDQASRRGVELVALHAWSDTGVYEFPGTDWSTFKSLEDQLLAERLAGWQERYPDVTVRLVVVSDRPAWALVEQSELRNSWSSAVTAAAGSPECRWARSARRWCSQRVCR
jgi:Universal stress protein family